jgi:hypothetical protein
MISNQKASQGKENHPQVEKQTTEWKIGFANHMSNKGLVSIILKDFSTQQQNNKSPVHKRTNDLYTHNSTKRYQRPTSMQKDAQYHH